MNPLFSIKELSSYLGIKEKTLYAKVSAKEIPHYKIDRLVRFKKEEIDRWIEEKKVEPVNPEQIANKIVKKLNNPNINIDAILKNAIENANHKPI
jgi:excisionase family DNA binding protein